MTHDQAIKLIEAHGRSEALQTVSQGRWVDYSRTAELWQLLKDMALEDFRVKPEPKTLYVPFRNGIPVVGFYNRAAAKAQCPDAEIVEFTETGNRT
jgi:hypothetical protein